MCLTSICQKFQDYFTHFEPCQLLGGAKTGDPQVKPPDHPQAELGLSHTWPKLSSNSQQWDDKRFRALEISGLNHSGTASSKGISMIIAASLPKGQIWQNL